MAQTLIWDAAVREKELREADRSQGEMERTMIVLGNKKSGKTSILLRFADRLDDKKQTSGLEYSYLRRSIGSSLQRRVTHIWELAGGASLLDLIDVPVKPTNLSTLSVVLVMDLSQPHEMWTLFQDFIDKIRSVLENVAGQIKQTTGQAKGPLDALREKAFSKYGSNHPDKEILKPLEVPLVVIGNKYDLFVKEFNEEQQKTIAKTLRYLAHTHGGTLMFTSCTSESLVLRSKGVLNLMAFGTPHTSPTVVDYDKPLLVPAGSDSTGRIGAPPVHITDIKIAPKRAVEFWKAAFTVQFPQKVRGTKTTEESPAADPQYAELVVDEMRKQKDQELLKYKQATEKAAKEQERRAKASGSLAPSGGKVLASGTSTQRARRVAASLREPV